MPEKFPVVKSAILGLFLVLAAGNAAMAEEDLTDNETCLECHADEEKAGLMTSEGPEVHTTAGEFHVEEHEMWNCVDCHMDIKEVPHAEGVKRTVDCMECHDEMPTG